MGEHTTSEDEFGSALGNDSAAIKHDITRKLFFQLMKFSRVATLNDYYLALAYAIRDRLLERWVRSARSYLDEQHRTVIYLSAEYLPGPQLGNALLNLGIEHEVREALASLGLSLDALIEHEEEPGLGNGGLGRLAACFMDSLATLGYPAIGHGIRYEFGIFDQAIRDGWQVELADLWLRLGNPWEVRRTEIEHTVGFGGGTERVPDGAGGYRVKWSPERVVRGVPSDTAVLGYRTNNTNFLRLWSAVAARDFDLDAFQSGDYWRAVEEKVKSENITKILYPNDESLAGRQLRLEQQYFFVSCAVQDCIRILLQKGTIHQFASKFRIQLNDTHPALAVPELMRLLMDVHGMSWDEAWRNTTESISYTNHTLMPEALESWPLPLFGRLLPRHLEIIYEINQRFLEDVRARRQGDEDFVRRVSIIDERGEKRVRMANLATVASHTINGVAALHSRLLRETVLRDFSALYPERFTNVTNGVTPRRFLALTNPRLTALINDVIGDAWLTNLDELRALEPYAEDARFRERWRAVKLANKTTLAGWAAATHGLQFDPSAMLNAHCKRFHEYKRQLLTLLHVIWLQQRFREGKVQNPVARTILLSGKAAPAYFMAKLVIRLTHAVAEALAGDPVRDVLRVVFVPDFNVKNAQRIYPAADVSLQISTAGTEASGTGNMKFAMSGALTLGTLDGANIEIRDAVGEQQFFLFGLTAEQIQARRQQGYDPRAELDRDPELGAVVEALASGRYSPHDRGLFSPIVDSLLRHDPYFVLADFRSYVAAQERVERAFRDTESWTRASILNTARTGPFSSDRSIKEYATRIWHVPAVAVK